MAKKEQLPEDDRFTGINPNELPPELLPLYKSMQADYTRKTQEAKAKMEEAERRVQEMEQQLQEITQNITQINDYVAALEDANKKWEEWYERHKLEDEQLLKGTQQQQQLTKQEVEVLSTDKSKLSEEALKQLDEYFINKYGKTFEQLADGLNKVSKQLGFKLQLDEVVRKYSKDIPDIDVQRVLKTAVETGTLDAKEAFERAYSNELLELEVKKRVEQRLKEIEEANRTKVLEGSSANIGQHIYVPRTEGPRTYEEATQSILQELGKL